MLRSAPRGLPPAFRRAPTPEEARASSDVMSRVGRREPSGRPRDGAGAGEGLDRIVLVYYCCDTAQTAYRGPPSGDSSCPRLGRSRGRRPWVAGPSPDEEARRDQAGSGCRERLAAARRVASGGAWAGRTLRPRARRGVDEDPGLRQSDRARAEVPQAGDAEGRVFKEMKLRAFSAKPSVKRKRKRAEPRRKRRKALARRARSMVD